MHRTPSIVRPRACGGKATRTPRRTASSTGTFWKSSCIFIIRRRRRNGCYREAARQRSSTRLMRRSDKRWRRCGRYTNKWLHEFQYFYPNQKSLRERVSIMRRKKGEKCRILQQRFQRDIQIYGQVNRGWELNSRQTHNGVVIVEL